ncbi:HORMA domain-containing protein 1, partial [Nowakowskiella sp. JEL0407]
MATVQLRRVEQITEQESLQRVKELLDTTVGSIAYLLIFDCLIHSTLTPPPYQKLKRGLFDEENFERELVDSVAVTKIHRNRSKNADQLLDWLEGVHDAIEKKYLKSLIFGIFEDPNEPEKLIESYTFNFDYPSGKSVNVSMDGGSKFPSHISSKQELARASQRVVRSLLLMISTLGTLPADVYITMKLYYYDDVTPQNYEPPGFAPTTTPEFYFPSKPVHLDIGDVKSIHHSVTLKMQTVKDNLEVDDENLKCIEEDLEFRRREDEALLANANGLNGIGNHQNAGNGPGTPTRYKVFGEEEGESTQEIIQKLFQGSTASKPPALRSNFETPTRILTNLESPSPYSITTAVTEQYNPSKDVSPAKTVIVNDMEIDQDLMDVKMEKYEEKSENELEDEFEIVNCGCSFNE